MTTRNFIAYFHAQLLKVKEDLTPAQYETLADTANLTPEQVAELILSIRTDEYQQELDWLYSLTQPSITKCIPLVKTLLN